MRWNLLAISVLAGLAATPAQAEFPWWVIGQRDIHSQSGDRQVFAVASDRRFISMRLCVRRQGVSFRQVEVRYREGGTQSFRIHGVVANQRCTGDIPLPEAERLAEVAVLYDSAGLNRRGARMMLHGR